MTSRIGTSIVAGLIAGVVFGIMMQMMVVPTPDGGQMSMIAMIGQIVGSPTVTAGWLYHLFNSTVVGSVFGVFLGSRVYGLGSGLAWGSVYGFGWWILGGLILMPALLGMPMFAPLTMPAMRTMAIGSLVGHLIYGLVLGGVFAWLVSAPRAAAVRPA